MSTNFDQSLNGPNSASRRAREDPKKGKSSEFNPRNDGQVNSSPSLKAWSYEGSNLYPKITFDIFSEIAQQMLAKFGN